MGSGKVQGALWGHAARDWADLQEPMTRPLWDAMLEAAGVREGTRLCDLGCGAGGLLLVAMQRGAIISGLDASENLVAIARERIPDAEIVVGEMENTPFDDACFDAVLACNSISYVENRSAAMQEMKRICAPGGKIVYSTWGPPGKVGFRTVFGAMRDALPAPPPGKGPFELSAPGELARLATDNGLDVVGEDDAVCIFEYDDYEDFWRNTRSAGVTRGAFNAISEEELKSAMRDAVTSVAGEDGKLRFENDFIYTIARRPIS